MEYLKRFWEKYRIAVIITAVFIVFVIFIAPGNLIKSGMIKANIRSMEKERTTYRDKAREDSTFLESMKDDEFLEKYARENFYMKRRGEEIYLVEE